MEFNLLFVLPDRKNQNILTTNADDTHQFPAYENPVGDNVGFDDPQLYNDFFKKLTGISVFRKYTFNTDHYVVFVFEQADEKTNVPTNKYKWISYDEFLSDQQNDEIKNIACSINRCYHKSINMPWVNVDGFAPYFTWLHEVCSANHIHIDGRITQVKNAYVSNVFCIPTGTEKLYMKIPGKVYITELPFTYELKKLGMADYPVWVDYNSDMNVFLMKDMGGVDLPSQSGLDILKKVVVQLAYAQKDSIQYLPLDCKHNDYRLKTILTDLSDFSQRVFDILSETKYKITHDEKTKLEQNIIYATKRLGSIKDIIPDTIQNGDVRPGNIRAIDSRFIFYDWAWGAVSHPFLELSTFLHIIRRTLPADIPAQKILVETYLNEWLEYGKQTELLNIFTVLDDWKELFMVYCDYLWVREIYAATDEPIEVMSADGWLLERRNYYFKSVLKRLIEKDV